jgi:hypothetical protein
MNDIIGRCENLLSRYSVCGNFVRADSFYEQIPELICESCVENLIRLVIPPREDTKGRPMKIGKKTTSSREWIL